jgi:hypothetical protein
VIDWPIGQWCARGQIDGVLDLAVQMYPVGEEKISDYSSMNLSTFFCCVERLAAETLDVVVTFLSFLERITKKKNFPI